MCYVIDVSIPILPLSSYKTWNKAPLSLNQLHLQPPGTPCMPVCLPALLVPLLPSSSSP